MIKVVIVDDEQFCIEVLETLIQIHFSTLEIVGTFIDASKAVEEIEHLNPDLLFLDINMPRLNGFDVLDRLMPFTFKVIFTTAYDTYAIKALKYGALDYLMKPISGEDLKLAITKFVSVFTRQNTLVRSTDFQLKVKKISIVNSDGILFQAIDDITYCEADNSYTIFHLIDGRKILASKTLKEFDMILSNNDFYRIHNTYLINLRYVEMYIKADGGAVVVNGEKLPISRTKKEDFIHLIQKFHEG